MADKELDAQTLEALDKAKILDQLYDNKATRPALLQGIKTIKPDARIPEIETAEHVLTTLTPHLKEIGETKAQLQQERDEFRAERAREKAKKELDLSDEEFVEVEKHAKAKQIGDLTAATEHYRMTREVAEPRSGPETTFHAPNLKGLWENPTQFARDEARKTLHEYEIAKRQRGR
ncbi:MAG TPA: hypothetical protein VKA83_17775 [Methylomirabilota bacterium]|nr:hypothetical protein [Methylomirabilota bacterium]